jgi:hypothetical protein
MFWATFWAIFSQAHLVTLVSVQSRIDKKINSLDDFC